MFHLVDVRDGHPEGLFDESQRRRKQVDGLDQRRPVLVPVALRRRNPLDEVLSGEPLKLKQIHQIFI